MDFITINNTIINKSEISCITFKKSVRHNDDYIPYYDDPYVVSYIYIHINLKNHGEKDFVIDYESREGELEFQTFVEDFYNLTEYRDIKLRMENLITSAEIKN